ncbi:MAG: hypothetical protein OXC44_05835 [Proteobacteria bacterium]|nr:hypothetical protein [Pseudomonadota bacterium]
MKNEVMKNVRGLCACFVVCFYLFSTTSFLYAATQKTDKEVQQAVGLLSLSASESHCSAFAIASQWIVSALSCVLGASRDSNNVTYGSQEDEYHVNYIFSVRSKKGKKRHYSVSLESYMPEKQVAYFYSEKMLPEYLEQGYSDATQLAFLSRSYKPVWYQMGEDIELFVVKNLFFYDVSLPDIALGSPLLNADNSYVGIHLGTAWHEGSDYSVGSRYFQDIHLHDYENLEWVEPDL